MRILWYGLTALFGVIGVLAGLRIVERLVSGAGIIPVQLIIAFVMLGLAVLCLQKARVAK